MKVVATILLICSFSSVSRAQCDADVREAFGGVSSITVYNTYLTIGAIADAYVNEVYTSDRVKELMGEQTAMIQAVIEMLSKCKTPKNDGLNADDVLYIKELISCLESLKGEAQGLSDYVGGSTDAQARYNTYRDKAWYQIKMLLGLEE